MMVEDRKNKKDRMLKDWDIKPGDVFSLCDSYGCQQYYMRAETTVKGPDEDKNIVAVNLFTGMIRLIGIYEKTYKCDNARVVIQ